MTTTHRHDDMTCDAFADALPALLERELDPAATAAARAHAASCAECGALLADLEGIAAAAATLPTLSPSRDLWAGIEARIEAPVVAIGSNARPTAVGSTRRMWFRHPAVAAAALVMITAGVTYVATKRSLAPVAERVAQVDTARPAATPVPADQASASKQLAEGQALASADSATNANRELVSDPKPRPGGPERAIDTDGIGSLASDRAETRGLGLDGAYGQEVARLRGIIRQRGSTLDPATLAEVEKNLGIIDSAIVRSRAALARDPASGFLTEQLTSALEKKVELLRVAATLPAARS